MRAVGVMDPNTDGLAFCDSNRVVDATPTPLDAFVTLRLDECQRPQLT